ncbi:hypothetical protein BDV12DRAFT_186373 [Aspergillus spectabilis]
MWPIDLQRAHLVPTQAQLQPTGNLTPSSPVLKLILLSCFAVATGDDESDTYRACPKTDDECERAISKIRFRHGSSAKYDSLFGKDQVWLRTSIRSQFDSVDESDAVIASYTRDPGSDEDGDDGKESESRPTPFQPSSIHGLSATTTTGSYGKSDLTPQSFHTDQLHTYCLTNSPSAHQQHHTSLRLEATLLRCWIEEMSFWFDICSPDRHRTEPVTFHPSCTPSHHITQIQGGGLHLVRPRHHRSQRINSPALLLPLHQVPAQSKWGLIPDQQRGSPSCGNRAKFYEEIDSPLENNTNKGVFLRVLNILMKAQIPFPDSFPLGFSTYTHATGIRRACLSIAFRRELYKSFITQRPVTLHLSRWSSLRSFSPAGDGTWADRLVLFCADVLDYCYGSSETNGLPCTHANSQSGEVFPDIWYASGMHATSITHLYLAQLLLITFDPTRSKLDSGNIAGLRRVAETMRETVIKLCWIALHNRWSPNVFVGVTMGIKAYGLILLMGG